MRLCLAALALALSGCGKRAAPLPAAPAAAAPATTAGVLSAPAPLFDIRFNDPAIPAAPDRTAAHPGPDDGQANRAGYTKGDIARKAGVAWESRPAEGGKVSLFARSVDVDYRMTITILVSSRFAEGTCPYRVTWEHELDHARAFRSIFQAEEIHLTGALEHAQETDPKIPTEDAPALLAPGEIDAFKKAAAEKLAAVLEDQTRVLSALMEDHRRTRDSPEAYRRDTDKCPAEDWRAL